MILSSHPALMVSSTFHHASTILATSLTMVWSGYCPLQLPWIVWSLSHLVLSFFATILVVKSLLVLGDYSFLVEAFAAAAASLNYWYQTTGTRQPLLSIPFVVSSFVEDFYVVPGAVQELPLVMVALA